MTQTPTFIVSAGRSGSTWLAKMINSHPEILCVSDILKPVGTIPYFDASLKVSGKEFFRVLSQESLAQRIKHWRKRRNEELLFLPEKDEMVSLLLCYTLPFLTGGKNPMVLYEKVRDEIESWQEDIMPEHFIRFCEFLRDDFQKKVWVERTGGGLAHINKILQNWPEAKVIHNYRDGRETAISMMGGSFFRLYYEVLQDPDLSPEWDMDSFDRGVSVMGRLWNRWVVDAEECLSKIPSFQKMHVGFENLNSDLRSNLLNIASFILGRENNDIDEEWVQNNKFPSRKPDLKFEKLNDEDQNKLFFSCKEGLKRLRYI